MKKHVSFFVCEESYMFSFCDIGYDEYFCDQKAFWTNTIYSDFRVLSDVEILEKNREEREDRGF